MYFEDLLKKEQKILKSVERDIEFLGKDATVYAAFILINEINLLHVFDYCTLQPYTDFLPEEDKTDNEVLEFIEAHKKKLDICLRMNEMNDNLVKKMRLTELEAMLKERIDVLEEKVKESN